VAVKDDCGIFGRPDRSRDYGQATTLVLNCFDTPRFQPALDETRRLVDAFRLRGVVGDQALR